MADPQKTIDHFMTVDQFQKLPQYAQKAIEMLAMRLGEANRNLDVYRGNTITRIHTPPYWDHYEEGGPNQLRFIKESEAVRFVLDEDFDIENVRNSATVRFPYDRSGPDTSRLQIHCTRAMRITPIANNTIEIESYGR